MNLTDIFEAKSDESETVKRVEAPGKLGPYITSAQAAQILGVEMSRIRQLIGDGKLKSYTPEDGRRDHMLNVAEVRAFKAKPKDKGGRPRKDGKKSD